MMSNLVGEQGVEYKKSVMIIKKSKCFYSFFFLMLYLSIANYICSYHLYVYDKMFTKLVYFFMGPT